MAISREQIDELVGVTMQDCPLPPVADVLCSATEEDADIIIKFIKKYYNKQQIKEGIREYLSRMKLINKMFGGKDGDNDKE